MLFLCLEEYGYMYVLVEFCLMLPVFSGLLDLLDKTFESSMSLKFAAVFHSR